MAAGGDAEVPVEDVPQPPAILHDDRIVVAQLRFQLLVLLVGHLQRPVLGGGVAGGQKHQRKGKDGYQQNYRQGQSQSGQKVFFHVFPHTAVKGNCVETGSTQLHSQRRCQPMK